MPCDETDQCPYDPSPGDTGALAPENALAVWLWERLQTLGPVAWDLVTLELTPAEAAVLLEQLHYLSLLQRQVAQEQQALS